MKSKKLEIHSFNSEGGGLGEKFALAKSFSPKSEAKRKRGRECPPGLTFPLSFLNFLALRRSKGGLGEFPIINNFGMSHNTHSCDVSNFHKNNRSMRLFLLEN